MKTNVLCAIRNFIQSPLEQVSDHTTSINRINAVGDSLETFVRDLFCGLSTDVDDLTRNKVYSEFFSYKGNSNNPPDMIIHQGDAVEVKKVEKDPTSIALNSSFPKNKLYANSHYLTNACKKCEKWEEKDIFYAIGIVKNRRINRLWFIHGLCYAASPEIYEKNVPEHKN